MGITIHPPDVNRSRDEFTVDGGDVVYGLGGIKNVGHGSIEAIVSAREDGGPFADLYEFCARVDMKALNKRTLESLAMAGAMDSLGGHRSTLVKGIDLAVEYAQNKQLEEDMGQFNLFGEAEAGSESQTLKPLPAEEPWNRMEKLANEKAVLGFWFSGHPLEGFAEEISAFTTPFNQLFTRKDRTPVTVGGVITAVARKTRKKDDKPFITLRVEDMESSGDVILMNGAFDEYKDTVEVDSMVIIEGTVGKSNGSDQPSVFAGSIDSLENVRGKRTRAVHITLSTAEAETGTLDRIIQSCSEHPGDLTLWINLKTVSSGNYEIKSNRFHVSVEQEFIRDLKGILGEDRVRIS